MKKECCNIKVSELDKGFTVEVTGDDLKNSCKKVLENCCSDNKSWKELISKCCASK